MLVVAYSDCFANVCEAVLHFLEYENGRWSEAAGAPPLDPVAMREIYRRKTGQAASEDNLNVIYSLSPIDKSITVKINGKAGDIEIYKLEWDGNIYDFAVLQE